MSNYSKIYFNFAQKYVVAQHATQNAIISLTVCTLSMQERSAFYKGYGDSSLPHKLILRLISTSILELNQGYIYIAKTKLNIIQSYAYLKISPRIQQTSLSVRLRYTFRLALVLPPLIPLPSSQCAHLQYSCTTPELYSNYTCQSPIATDLPAHYQRTPAHLHKAGEHRHSILHKTANFLLHIVVAPWCSHLPTPSATT